MRRDPVEVSWRRRHAWWAIALACALLFGLASVAEAAFTASRTASDYPPAIFNDPGWAGAAAFDTIPPNNNPDSISDSAIAGFPLVGQTYAMLSNGSADAEKPGNGIDGGALIRGTQDGDVTVLRIPLTVPSGANCLSLDYRFMTQEQPGIFKDSFIAELDTSDWTTVGDGGTGDVVAPHDFAPDQNGRPLNADDSPEVTVADKPPGASPAYIRGTALRRASTPVSSGQHTLFLSVFDWQDMEADTAVFVDRVHLTANPDCILGSSTPPDDLVAPTSSASVPACSADGNVPVTVDDGAGGSGARAVHYSIDGGPEQVQATGGDGTAAVGVPDGTHQLTFWGDDKAANLETSRHTVTVVADQANGCRPPTPVTPTVARPRVAVAGVATSPCRTANFTARVSVTAPGRLRRVDVFLDGRRVRRSARTRLSVPVPARGLRSGSHVLRIVATDRGGRTTTRVVRFSRCARRAVVAPRFTG